MKVVCCIVMLYYVMACYVMLCYVMLCYVKYGRVNLVVLERIFSEASLGCIVFVFLVDM
jgi:hypothetical protein